MTEHPDIRQFLPRGAVAARELVAVEFRRTIFSEQGEVLPFTAGATVAELVAAFEVPAEFETHGVVFVSRAAGEAREVPREMWHLVRPKPGTGVFISCAPQGRGSDILQVVAVVALMALTLWVGGGGLAFGNPMSFFAAGQLGASATSAAIGVAGAAALNALARRGISGGGGTTADTATLGAAGIGQNALGLNGQIPWPMGRVRFSPPQLVRSWTTIEGTDQYVHGIVGCCGPVHWDGIQVNETRIEDLPEGQFEHEIRRGYADDPPITLIKGVAFEEPINLEMSKHRLDKDGQTLINPAAASYPQPHVFRTARGVNRFRLTLAFPQGLSRFDAGTDTLAPFRLEVREVGTSTWRKLPELHLEAAVRAPMRQEIWLHFGGDEMAILASISGTTSNWVRAYAQNAEWTADPYFNPAPLSVDINNRHVFAGRDQIHLFLDRAEFPGDRYDVRIVRGFVQDAGAQHTSATYTGGLFTFRTSVPPNVTIVNQTNFGGSVAIQSYTSFRDEYPFREPGLALLAFRARNLQINSLNAEATPIIPVWDGEAWVVPDPDADPEGLMDGCSNPAALCRYVLTGPLNARPRPDGVLEGFEDWYTFCEAGGLSCNTLVADGSVERAANLAANCGDAVLRESDTLSPVIDRDRSTEPVAAAFSAHNMISPLVMEKSFEPLADGILATFNDGERDFVSRTRDLPIYADGTVVAESRLLEGTVYDGLAYEHLVVRRARLDMRRARARAVRYSFETDQEQLDFRMGAKISVAHDILLETYGMGRLQAWQAKDGNLLSLTMNGEMLDPPTPAGADLYAVDHLYVRTLDELYEITGPALGVMLQLEDNTHVTVPITHADGATLYVEQGEHGFPLPVGIAATHLVSVGARGRETRPLIVMNIEPRSDLKARIDAVDLAPHIFTGV